MSEYPADLILMEWGKEMKFTKKIALVAVAAACAGIATTASADVFADAFDSTLGSAQVPAATTYQSKYAERNGTIQVSTIGADYNVDAQMCQFLFSCGGGTKVYEIPEDNQVRGLPNSYSAGTESLTAALQTSTWNAAQVQVQGYWQAW